MLDVPVSPGLSPSSVVTKWCLWVCVCEAESEACNWVSAATETNPFSSHHHHHDSSSQLYI